MARNKYPEVTIQRIVDAAGKLFIEKGYENTTIQDIVDELGDLSKGAIYHHFKSKEEIIEAVGSRVHQNVDFRRMYEDEKGMTGRDKIKQIALYCMRSTEQRQLMKSAPAIMENPKFLAMEVRESVEKAAPIIASYVREGNEDGSLHVTYPDEAAEIFMLLSNVWINPLVFEKDEERFEKKVKCLKNVLDGIGLTVMDDEVIETLLEFNKALD